MGNRARRMVLVLLISIGGCISAFCLFFGSIGYGRFYQEVTMESDVPVNRLLYYIGTVDEEFRKRLEEKADPDMICGDEADRIAEDRFQVRVTFTSSGCPFFGHTIHYQRQLIAYAELQSGKWKCRIVDLPRDKGTKRLMISLR